MPLSTHVVLLGAGFSRNWGGWLAAEAFDYLLGCPEVDEALKIHLWNFRDNGGFEAALGELQEEQFARGGQPDVRLTNLEAALRRMFSDMNIAFAERQFEFSNSVNFSVARFLARFDAIFTLNQDLLLERFYLNENISLMTGQRWDGFQVAGVRPAPSQLVPPPGYMGRCEPDPANFRIEPRRQPYFKLHGSINWFSSGSNGLLVLGTKKPSLIAKYPVLDWMSNEFRKTLLKPGARLMVIGYSFADDHINAAISDAVTANNLAIYVVNPLGADVLDSNRVAIIRDPSELSKTLRPRLVGFSTRPLSQTFAGDHAEHAKLTRFFVP